MLCLSVALWLFGNALVLGAPPLNSVSCFKLTQSSRLYGETISFTYCQEGFLWENPSVGLNIVASAPDWTVHTCNLKTRTYFDQPLTVHEGYMHKPAVVLWGVSLPRIPFVKWQEKDLLGLRCHVYRMKGGLSKPELLALGIAAVEKAELLTTDSIGGSKPVVTFLRRQYDLPDWQAALSHKSEVPLSMSITTKGKSQIVLATSKIDRVSLPSSIFKLPPGFKKLKSSKKSTR
ncbi:MAG: hypothetical protein K2Y32_14220 [Candidatus Obscuribacterales bacterium]|nr:hypothetical protein [Candidatus Obscuribacterales bacterium]